jgi:hypothetical protein
MVIADESLDLIASTARRERLKAALIAFMLNNDGPCAVKCIETFER